MNGDALRSRPPSPADPPVVMGILNVTADSFSDGGRFLSVDAAAARATEMIEEGAAIIDVGAESTRPGAGAVPAEEQIRRAAPVIGRVRARHPSACISIDTQSSDVARAALDSGADWINDVSALRADPEMIGFASARGCPVVLMHMQGTPRTMQSDPAYGDVVADVTAFLVDRVEAAVAAGVSRERLVVDPGIGFGKTVAHNLEILRRLRELVRIGLPVLIGVSRKSFIGTTLGIDRPDDRLHGSLACAAAAVLAGARIIRAHDVRATVEVVRMCNAVAPADK